MRELTIATVQFKPKLGEPEENLVKMSEFISKIATQQKVDLVIFPELATSGYELGVRFTEVAQRVPGPSVNLLAQRAAEYGIYIAFGLVTKEKVESVIFNSAVMVGPDGELVGSYNKVHLRGEERMAFREGFRFPVFETEIGNIGLMVGWDLAFPEVARSLVMEGAEVLCALVNWESAHIDEYRAYLKSRALENGIFVAASNRVGEDVTLSFGGESMIVGPRGKVHASLANESNEEEKSSDSKEKKEEAKEKEAEKEKKEKEAKKEPREGFAVTRIDLDEVRKCREEFQMIQSRQPTTYRSIVKRY